jgi:hypothetical protein
VGPGIRRLPLYAVGVFLAFTLSQTGMVVHWLRHRDQPRWRHSLASNATGAVLSGIVFVIAGVTKFTAGAWVAIVLIGLIIVIALRIHRYYEAAGKQLALHPDEPGKPASPPPLASPRVPLASPGQDVSETAAADGSDAEAGEDPGQIRNLTIVPVLGLNRASGEPWPMPRRSASRRSPFTSARPPRRPTGSVATGRHGETTCPSKSSSPRTAP